MDKRAPPIRIGYRQNQVVFHFCEPEDFPPNAFNCFQLPHCPQVLPDPVLSNCLPHPENFRRVTRLAPYILGLQGTMSQKTIPSQKKVFDYFQSKKPHQQTDTSKNPLLSELVPRKRKREVDETRQVGRNLSQGTMSPPEPRKKANITAHRIRNEKVMNDPVHGRIFLPGVAVALIDTPQFQRLRKLKQLGLCYYVYPGACHNRFEHSLGVAHLAGTLITNILNRQPELKAPIDPVTLLPSASPAFVTPNDVVCVQLAGLLHDLGHGPFSHVFDNVLLKNICPGSSWNHEEAGCKLIDYMLLTNNIDLSAYGLDKKRDIEFIKECIVGVSKQECDRRDEHKAWDRPRFLYFIINNKESGLDVDKLDYYQRDCAGAGLRANDKFSELLDTASVVKCTDHVFRLCYPEKYYESVFDAFHIRFKLHRKVYQHRVVKAVEYMLCDALSLAHDHLLLPTYKKDGSLGKEKSIAESLDDLGLYTRLNDSILDLIWHSVNPKLDAAKMILRRIEIRNLYLNLGQVPMAKSLQARLQKHRGEKHVEFQQRYKREVENITEEIASYSDGLDACHLIVDITVIHHGKKDGSNPVDQVYFFKKGSEYASVLSTEKFQSILPRTFIERGIRVYCRERSLGAKAQVAFNKWCKRQDGAFSPICSFSQDTSKFHSIEDDEGSTDEDHSTDSTDYFPGISCATSGGLHTSGSEELETLVASPSRL